MDSKSQKLAFTKSASWQIFDQISPRYDLLNHLLSFGLDIHWRRCLNKFILKRSNQKILDLASGTADVLITLIKMNKHIYMGYGIDLAEKMLEIGREKILKCGLDKQIILKNGDANQIPFDENTFDNVTMAFGIRNVESPLKVLQEINRVLNKRGRALILEFSLPSNSIIRFFHLGYLRHIVPFIGFIFSGHYQAYKYLNQSIEQFPYGADFCTIMKEARFENVRANPLLFGVATIYQGDKL